MYALILGISVGACELLVDKIRGDHKVPLEYIKDIGLVFLGMTLLELLGKL